MSKKILKIMFLLSVMVLSGCGKQNTETVAETEAAVETEEEQETDTPEDMQTVEEPLADTGQEEEVESPEETESAEVSDTSAGNGSGQSGNRNQTADQQETTRTEETAKVEEPAQAEEPAQSEVSELVSYSPQRVVELAVEQTKAKGKIYIPDDLNQMLAAGEISQEDYDACYPTDGAGYLEYYVATDMNEARDISGTVQFSSESDIAANIAGMYAALPQQYFYIEYHGTVMYGGRECYVFYCYRA